MWAETAKTTWGLTEIGDKQGSLNEKQHGNFFGSIQMSALWL